MSRINPAVSFTEKITLQTACFKKHTDDGTGSILRPYLDENSIDFVADVAKGVDAVALNVSATSLLGKSKKATQDRNKSFKPAWKTSCLWVQFLKNLFTDNTAQLSDWGVPVDTNGKIKYPAPFKERVAITQAIITKNNSYTTTPSPLQPYITSNNNNLTTISTNITNAIAFDISRKELKANSVKATQDRDKAFDQPYINLKGIGGFLVSLFPDSPKDVALWGYDEVDTKVPETEKTFTLFPLIKRGYTGILLGSVLTNVGLKDIIVAAGKKGLGVTTTVPPGGILGMNKGYSAIVVFNPATIGEAKFTITTR